ncbi:PHP and PHP_C domain-containing protein [Ktedonobacteria bacterium brp13]|nr:PHP and PHP_C domain-containing protein [Ktedonobacteria bacterium brp13]
MVTSNYNRAMDTTAHSLPGIDMLKKRSKMTFDQARDAGKQSKADLHMHSTYSDGCATIEEILEYAQNKTDLDVIAITDHDVIDGALRARDLWSNKAYRFDFVVGEEVSTQEGHLLGLFIEKQIPQGLSIERSIDLIHEQGGLAIIAHPLHRFFRHSCQKEVMDRIHASKDVWLDGIESWNASFCGIYSNYIAMGANRELYRLPEVGNSDAHTLNSIGSGMTWFSGHSAADVRAAIEGGATAPGGTLWNMQVYYHFLHYRYVLNKEQRDARRPMAVA